jgi:hypothetical protein
MFYKFSMASSVMLCIWMVGLEVFGSKTPIMQVLDCHNSPREQAGRHGEYESRVGGVARPELASRAKQLAMASDATRLASEFVHQSTTCSPQALLSSFELVLPVQSFIKTNPSNQGPI